MEKILIPPNSTGLVFGKFMPLHNGHCYLIESAFERVEKLVIIVICMTGDPIPGFVRFTWIRKHFPKASVFMLMDETPELAPIRPDVADVWAKILLDYCGPGQNILFTSVTYGEALAERMGIPHIGVDVNREKFPLFESVVRTCPQFYWNDLPKIVQDYYLIKIVICGPNSELNASLARNLAKRYNTVRVPEVKINKSDDFNHPIQRFDLERAGKEQIDAEEKAVPKANRIIFLNSDLIGINYYCEYLFGHSPFFLRTEAEKRKYSLYIIVGAKTVWETGDNPEEKYGSDRFFQEFKIQLDSRNREYIGVAGSEKEMLDRSVAKVNEILFGPPPKDPILDSKIRDAQQADVLDRASNG